MNAITAIPNAEEMALAKLSSQELAAVIESQGESQLLSVIDSRGQTHEVTLPVSALKLMVEVLTQLGQGNSVNITPIQAKLTTQEAANLLNMSRPTLIKLLDSGALPFNRTGNRRKVPFAAVLEYKQNLQEQRLSALDELSALDQELGLGY